MSAPAASSAARNSATLSFLASRVAAASSKTPSLSLPASLAGGGAGGRCFFAGGRALRFGGGRGGLGVSSSEDDSPSKTGGASASPWALARRLDEGLSAAAPAVVEAAAEAAAAGPGQASRAAAAVGRLRRRIHPTRRAARLRPPSLRHRGCPVAPRLCCAAHSASEQPSEALDAGRAVPARDFEQTL